ncbi:MAG TPA: AbrB/MazE/SpoVT family DNA-binding domain-containing protein [Rhizomicrobium sp.]|jgi:AbrB family looped-hinge helix DNA binding protein|nr:AbrB/MazE/SpoVT family DNA-binding domain-containing protein [Rhizomicrobium sp.]
MATATLDDAGRFVIPKPVRDELGLSPGDRLSVESDGQRLIVERVRTGGAVRKENGVWVFRSGQPVSAAETDDVLREIRRGRDRAFRGSGM